MDNPDDDSDDQDNDTSSEDEDVVNVDDVNDDIFLQEVDKELDMMHQGDYIVMSELDTISTPTDEQAQLLSNKAKLQTW